LKLSKDLFETPENKKLYKVEHIKSHTSYLLTKNYLALIFLCNNPSNFNFFQEDEIFFFFGTIGDLIFHSPISLSKVFAL
jgi:DUF438 domain-containing protein